MSNQVPYLKLNTILKPEISSKIPQSGTPSDFEACGALRPLVCIRNWKNSRYQYQQYTIISNTKMISPPMIDIFGV